MKFDFDFAVIGSGFGGSVSAHRLTEKGYSVGVFEMGKRYEQNDFPKSNWSSSKYLWAPAGRLFGFFKMTLFKHAWVLSGVGVGGGSLVYANTLLVPPDRVWDSPLWADLEDWKTKMPVHYAEAKRMLGVTENQYLGTADKILKAAAEDQGFGDTFYKTDVAIYFGKNGQTAPDPYFGGEGPERSGCTYCGGCMVGCRYNAKNTLDKNYLYFAEKRGAKVIAETRVIDVQPINGKTDGADGYEITTESSTSFFKKKRTWRVKNVVFSAGVMGTVKLLLNLKAKGSLPNLSDQLGNHVRTNSEAIIGVKTKDKSLDMSEGIAIGSGIHIDEDTHIEVVRYPKKSDALGSLVTLMPPQMPKIPRALAWITNMMRHPIKALRVMNPFGFATSSLILLVMQTADATINLSMKRRWYWPLSKKLQTSGDKIPSNIPQANTFARKLAGQIDGTPSTSLTEMIFDVPTTAHILGGASMGNSDKDGVINGQNQVFNYKNMYVCDGSMIGANLGVNPSLTITALTEHAMSFIPPAAASQPKPNQSIQQSTPTALSVRT